MDNIILDKDKDTYMKEVRARERILRVYGVEGQRQIISAREAVGYTKEKSLDDLDIMTLEGYIKELKLKDL